MATQGQLFAIDCDPPAMNAWVTDKQLRRMGWTRSWEEYVALHGAKAKRKGRKR